MRPGAISPLARARPIAPGRPAADAACAGCAQLGLFRALRRAGLDVQGGPGCDPRAEDRFVAAPGRWAAVAGARTLLANPRALLASARAAGARLVAVADRGAARRAGAVEAALATAGATSVRVDPADLGAVETAARAGLEPDSFAVLVALSPCPRGAPRSPSFAIAASRCNRCGACLALGCPAAFDAGGDAVAIDAATCTGCGLCVPLCRGRAIVRSITGV